MATPAPTGAVGAASPAQGIPSPLTGLLATLTQLPQIIQQAQLQKLQADAQKQALGKQLLSTYAEQVAANPTLAQNPGFVKNVQGVGKLSGLPIPMTQQVGAGQYQAPAGPNGQPGQKFDFTVPTGKQQLDTSTFEAQEGSGLTQWINANSETIMATRPDQRQGLAEASLGRKLTPAESQTLQNMPQQYPAAVQGKMQEQVFTTFQKQVSDAIKNNDPKALEAAVQFATTRAQQLGLPSDAFQAFADSAITDMSPIQAAKLAKDQAITDTTRALLQPKIDEANARVDALKGETQHWVTESQVALQTLPATLGKLRAETAKAYSDIANSSSRNALDKAEAGWYIERVRQGQLAGGASPQLMVGALNSIGRTIDVDQQQLGILSQLGIKYQGTIGAAAASPADKAAAAKMLQQTQGETQHLQSEINSYQQQRDSITARLTGVAPTGQNYNFQQPSDGGADFASDTGAPPPQSSGPAPTQINPANGKLYYYWPTDSAYHSTPPKSQ